MTVQKAYYASISSSVITSMQMVAALINQKDNMIEKAPVQRKSSVVETESIIEEDTSDMREVMDEDNEDDEPLELDSEDEE